MSLNSWEREKSFSSRVHCKILCFATFHNIRALFVSPSRGLNGLSLQSGRSFSAQFFSPNRRLRLFIQKCLCVRILIAVVMILLAGDILNKGEKMIGTPRAALADG